MNFIDNNKQKNGDNHIRMQLSDDEEDQHATAAAVGLAETNY